MNLQSERGPDLLSYHRMRKIYRPLQCLMYCAMIGAIFTHLFSCYVMSLLCN